MSVAESIAATLKTALMAMAANPFRRRHSKHKPAPLLNSGPEAAANYLRRRSIRSGKHSSLRKLMRAENIARGRRNEREGVKEANKYRFRKGRP